MLERTNRDENIHMMVEIDGIDMRMSCFFVSLCARVYVRVRACMHVRLHVRVYLHVAVLSLVRGFACSCASTRVHDNLQIVDRGRVRCRKRTKR